MNEQEKEYLKVRKAYEDNVDYIKEHRANVKKAYEYLIKIGIISADWIELKENIENHDISKMSNDEFVPYASYFFFPNGKELFKEDFDKAWLHHIHNNPHHWNYWVLVDGVGDIKALEMPKVYVYEMICDWLSFSIRNGDLTEIKTFNEMKRNEYIFHPNTRKLVDQIIDTIVDKVNKERLLCSKK
jgi:hypothetical protein